VALEPGPAAIFGPGQIDLTLEGPLDPGDSTIQIPDLDTILPDIDLHTKSANDAVASLQQSTFDLYHQLDGVAAEMNAEAAAPPSPFPNQMVDGVAAAEVDLQTAADAIPQTDSTPGGATNPYNDVSSGPTGVSNERGGGGSLPP
jgi:hypothetical protein